MNSTTINQPSSTWLSSKSVHVGNTQIPNWFSSLIVCVFSVYAFQVVSNWKSLPVINSPRWFQPLVWVQIDFVKNGMNILASGRETFVDKPYKMITHMGDVIVLPPRFASIIRNETDLDLRSLLAKVSVWARRLCLLC